MTILTSSVLPQVKTCCSSMQQRVGLQLTLTLLLRLMCDTGLTAAAGNNCSMNCSALSIEYTPLISCCCSCLLLLLLLLVAAVLVPVCAHNCTFRSATAAHHLGKHEPTICIYMVNKCVLCSVTTVPAYTVTRNELYILF
jgi:hypothetical protein